MENIVYGKSSTISSINEKKVKKVFLNKNFNNSKFLSEIKKNDIEIQFVENSFLDKLTHNGNHQGIACVVDDYQFSTVEEIIRISKGKKCPFILMLDGIEDPHNFGAIIRTCDAFSVDGIIIKSRNQVQPNMTVSKVSTGAINYVKIAQVSNLNNVISKLKENGYWIYSADGSGNYDYSKLQYDRPICLIVGSEGFGVSKLVLKNSDFIVKIPMTGHVNSLNVSVATAILISKIRQ